MIHDPVSFLEAARVRAVGDGDGLVDDTVPFWMKSRTARPVWRARAGEAAALFVLLLFIGWSLFVGAASVVWAWRVLS
jgi:hypothetical protein